MAETVTKRKRRHKPHSRCEKVEGVDPRMTPDWTKVCLNCGASPIVPETGLCGPCTFGEADTSGGNW